MPSIALANNKGGSLKTTATKNLAVALARDGASVLTVDVDPQANLSRRCGVAEDRLNTIVTVSEVIKADTAGCAADAIVEVGWPGVELAGRVDLIPSRLDLEKRVSEAAELGAIRRLHKGLRGVADAYDWVLFDCPPSMGHITQLALAAADAVVIPVVPEYDSLQGATRVTDFVGDEENRLNIHAPHLRVAGVIVGSKRNIEAHNFHVNGIAELFPGLVWEPYVPAASKGTTAEDQGLPPHAYRDARSRELAEVYDALALRLVKEMS